MYLYAGLTSTGKHLILLHEISWMGGEDKDFAGKLKGAWDNHFKKNDALNLVLCGSVTTWIEENILQDKGFVGRVSLDIVLKELSLPEANEFWRKAPSISATEKLKILSVTGGAFLAILKKFNTSKQRNRI